MSTRKDLPQASASNFSQRVRETLLTYLGKQGDRLDRGLTVRDLIEAGVIKFKAGFGGQQPIDQPLPIEPGPSVEPVYEVDLTPPPTPTGFTATGAISNFLVECDPPVYTQGHGHDRSILYGTTYTTGPLPTFSAAVPLTEFLGSAASYASNPSTTWRLWLTWRTVDGVESVAPAGGINGLEVTTGQDVALLLEALTGQITAGELATSLATRIDLIDNSEVGSVNARIATEAAARAAALAAEAAARGSDIAAEAALRTAGDAAEASARVTGLAAEAANRASAIATEATTRANALVAEALARATDIAAEAKRREDILVAILGVQDIAPTLADVIGPSLALGFKDNISQVWQPPALTALSAGLLYSEREARATQDGAFTTAIDGLVATTGANTAAIASEITARTTADSAQALQTQSISAMLTGDTTASATLDYVVGPSLDVSLLGVASYRVYEIPTLAGLSSGLLQQERDARVTAVSAEATARDTLAAQLRGGYTGTDLDMVTSGLIYTERQARASAITALASEVSLISAGVGEQFDYKTIWFFDAGVDGFTGNGTPTTPAAGWLRPASHGSDPYVESPTGIAAVGAQYNQLRARIRKVGTQTWDGKLWWRAAADATWDAARRVDITEPTYDGNGIGLLTVTPGWTGITVDRIRLDLSTSSDASNYFEIDWVAVGRPSPGASNAALAAEITARAAADSAEVTARQTLQAQLVGAYTGTDPASLTTGLLYNERQARVTAEGAIVTSVDGLSAEVDANLASLNAEITARADADTAIIATATALAATVGANTAAITSEATARASADDALADTIEALGVVVDGNTADIVTEANVRATADSAEATRRESLVLALTGREDFAHTLAYVVGPSLALGFSSALAAVWEPPSLAGFASGYLYEERTARIADDAAIVSSVTALGVTVSGNTAAISAEATARADADTAITASVTALSSTVDGNTAAIVDEAATRASRDEVNALKTSGLSVLMTGSPDAVQSLAYLQSPSLDVSLLGTPSYRVFEVATLASLASGLIFEEKTLRVTETTALASSLSALAATVAGNTAAITSEATTRASADTALASSITTLTSTVSGNTAAIATEASTRATETGNLFAKYTVKIDLAGHVSGYGLLSEANNGATVSQFGVRANQFFLAPPAVSQPTAPSANLYKGYVWVDTSGAPVTKYWTGSAWSTAPQALPFVVQLTPTTINGVAVPEGVYIDSAYILNGTITNAKIGNAAIDDAKVANMSVAKLIAGSVAVGEYIQSTGYVAGSAGFRISGNGSAEFSGVVVRGTIYASAGTIGGSTIGSNYMRSTNYVLNSLGWNLNSDGTGQIGGLAVLSDAVQSSNFVAGTSGWRLRQNGTLEASAADLRGGTIIGGLIRNTADTARVNLNASGATPFILAGDVVDYGPLHGSHNEVEIRADGTAYLYRGAFSGGVPVASSAEYTIPLGDRPLFYFGYAIDIGDPVDAGA